MAAKVKAPLTVVSNSADVPENLPLLGDHQRQNAAVALATVNFLQSVIPVSDAAIARGLEAVSWAGRLQRVRRGNREILLDGAHNPDGARTLAAALREHFRGQTFTLILGLFADKSWKEMCEILVPLAERVFLVPLAVPRSADVNEVRDYCASRWPDIQVFSCDSVAAAIKGTEVSPLRVVAGSLHLVGEAMEVLGIFPASNSERVLNEWNAANEQAISP
jgi:dihydrofolate synthase/folylpolyglutamate synthase